MKHFASTLCLGVVLMGCGASESLPSGPLSVQITSHSDKQHVTGVINLAGNAVGGIVEVAIDDQVFLPVAAHDWSLEVDSDSWTLGWHVVQARVTSGARQSVVLINLYAANGYEPAPTPTPPPVVQPTPPTFEEPPTDGLVAHWDFESGAQDVWNNLLGGTIYGGASVSNGVLDFDGTDDAVHVPDNATAAPAAIAGLAYGTISVRFKLEGHDTSSPAAETAPLFYLGSDEASSTANGSDSVSIYIAHGNLFNPNQRQVFFTILKAGKVILCFDTSVAIQQDQWTTYAVSIGPDGHRAYLDGVEVERNYNAGTTANDYAFFQSTTDPDILTLGYGHFAINRYWWYFNGKLADVRIYDRALSPSEVALVASAG